MTIEITPEALNNLGRIVQHIRMMGELFGEDGKEFVTANTSWLHAQASIWRLMGHGDSRLVASDDPLGLSISTPNLYVAVVFHRDRSFDDAMIPNLPGVYVPTYMAGWCGDHFIPCTTSGDHRDCYQRTVPIPGDWSLHS